MTFRYRTNMLPSRVIVVGAGGTGGRLIPWVAQLLKSLPFVLNPEIVVIDGDVVETKNLIRQNFVAQDVGKMKAEVMCGRYGRAYDIAMTPISEFVTRENIINLVDTLNSGGVKQTAMIMAVDKVDARRLCIELATRLCVRRDDTITPTFIIDTGNEATFGQVNWFHAIIPSTDFRSQAARNQYMSGLGHINGGPVTYDIPFIPCDWRHYDAMVDNPGESCGGLDQTLAVNSLVAVNALAALQNLYFNVPFTSRGTQVSLLGTGLPMPINAEYLAGCASDDSSTRSDLHRRLRDSRSPIILEGWLTAYSRRQSEEMARLQELAVRARQAEEDRVRKEALAANATVSTKTDAAIGVGDADIAVAAPRKKVIRKVRGPSAAVMEASVPAPTLEVMEASIPTPTLEVNVVPAAPAIPERADEVAVAEYSNAGGSDQSFAL